MAGSTPGRKPKLNRETETRLLSLLRAGVPKEVACAGVGIDSRTLRIWLTRARAGEVKYQEFADKLEAAQAEAQSSMLVQIRKHGAKDWKAVAWMLERVFSERYGYKSQVKISVEAELEKLLDVAQTVLGAESAAKLFEALAGAASSEATTGASGEATLAN